MKQLASIFKEILYSGLESFGKYYSSYRGVVADNNDPDSICRLKLIVPEVTGNDPYDYWAPAKGVYSGKDRGMQIIPDIGDIVWVEFEHGDPEHPIWMHGHFGVREKPIVEGKDFDDVNSFWFMTPKGNTIYINDTDGIINITSSDQDDILINKRAISLSTTKKISLGQKDKSNEPALLGDKTEDALDQIYDLLNEIVNTLNQDVIASTATGQPFLVRAALAAKVPTWLPKIIQLKKKIKLIKSKKVTLD